MNTFRLSLGVMVAALSVLASAASIQAQTGPAQAGQSAPSISNTGWIGGEDLNNVVGELGFALRSDGTAVMFDRFTAKNNTPVNGHWQQNGSQVTIRFSNCIYTGRINGDQITGTASYSDNLQARWNFAVKFAPPQR